MDATRIRRDAEMEYLVRPSSSLLAAAGCPPAVSPELFMAGSRPAGLSARQRLRRPRRVSAARG